MTPSQYKNLISVIVLTYNEEKLLPAHSTLYYAKNAMSHSRSYWEMTAQQTTRARYVKNTPNGFPTSYD